MKIRKTINSAEEMMQLGEKIGRLAQPNMVIALSGDLGAGKTVLTKGLGRGLGITSTINSPTFTIMKIYQGRMPLYHMDVYRINQASQDDDLEEYFEKDGLCVIEWADNIDYLLPKARLVIDIAITGDHQRSLEIAAEDPEYQNIIERIQ